jgi:uncharacterized membrane protein
MTKIAAVEERTLRVTSPLKDVYKFFIDPELIKEETADVHGFERVDGSTARFVLVEKVEKGIRYQADYTVEYKGNGSDEITWRTIRGNLEATGTVRMQKVTESITEIQYRESVAPDLPITQLMAMLFKPIVAREVRKDIGKFLDRVEARFGRVASGSSAGPFANERVR